MRQPGLVGENHSGETVFRPHRTHELLRSLSNLVFALLHAAAGIEREHDGDGIHRLLERVDFLLDAVFEHIEIVRRHTNELQLRILYRELDTWPDRRWFRRKVTCTRARLESVRDFDVDLAPRTIDALIQRRVRDQIAITGVGCDLLGGFDDFCVARRQEDATTSALRETAQQIFTAQRYPR